MPPDVSGLDALYAKFLRARPHGWSVVRAEEALFIRPPDRERGKFRLILRRTRRGEPIARMLFFDRSRNHWTESANFSGNDANSATIFGWMHGVLERDPS